MTGIVREVTIGNCRLIQGDCLECLSFVGEYDTLLADPPYSILNKFPPQAMSDGTRALAWSWDQECTPIYIAERIGAALDQAKKRASFCVWCGTDQVGDLLPVFRSRKFMPKPAAWIKKYPPPAIKGTWWPSGFELAFYGYRNSPFFGDDDTKRSNTWIHDSYRHGQPGKVDHPTQKPLDLMLHLVRSLVPPDGTALDCFMGSASTGVACVREGRKFIGIEKDEKFFDLCCRRIQHEWAIKSSELKFDEPEEPKQSQRYLFKDPA